MPPVKRGTIISVRKLEDEYDDDEDEDENCDSPNMKRHKTFDSSPRLIPKKPAMRRKVSKTMSNLRANIAEAKPKDWSPIRESSLKGDDNHNEVLKVAKPSKLGVAKTGKVSNISSTSESLSENEDNICDLPSQGSYLHHPKSIGGTGAIHSKL